MRFLPDSVFPDCGLPLVTHRVESGLKIALCWRMWGKLSSLIHRLSFCLWYKPSDRCFSGPHYISLNSFPFSFRKSHISLPNKCNWSQKTSIVNTKRKKYAFILLLELLLYDMKHSSSKSISISPSFLFWTFLRHHQNYLDTSRNRLQSAMQWFHGGHGRTCRGKQGDVQMRQTHRLDCMHWETWVTLFSLLNQENKAVWFCVLVFR